MDCLAIERARKFSDDRLEEMRAAIKGEVPDGAIVLTCGSFARREASSASDLDFFCLDDGGERGAASIEPAWLQPLRDRLLKIVPKPASAEGAFGEVMDRGSLLKNIGGNGDSNEKITRRMLLLLEGEWLSNPDGFHDLRSDILTRYVSEGILDHQLALFLLNDVIRFYRTMAVDYEYKTVEAERPKPWAIRHIKLIFSRKLLYVSGVFSIALTADRVRERKLDRLTELFSMPVMQRMEHICGRAQLLSASKYYNYFLASLEKSEVRDHLNSLRPDQRQDETFRDLKNEGHHFTRELQKLFDVSFDSTHPIRRAIMF